MDFVFLRDIRASRFLEGNVFEKKFELGTLMFKSDPLVISLHVVFLTWWENHLA